MMADLNTLIAQGPPRMDFSPLSTLFDSYGAGQKARRQQDVWDARRQAGATGADGKPDYAATARNLLNAGDIEGARYVAAMARDMGRAATGAATDDAGGDAVAPRATDAAPRTMAGSGEPQPMAGALGRPWWPKIPFAAAGALKADPSLREEFNRKYGGDYAAIVLGPDMGR